MLSVLVQKIQTEPSVSFGVNILDGAAVVHFLSTTSISTFNDYAGCVFIPHIMKKLESSKRVDVVWDTYIVDSIKEPVRERRGKGIRRKVIGKNKVPSNWPDSLRDSTNKQELFNFLSNKVALTECPDGKQIFIASGKDKSMSLPIFHCFTGCDTTSAFFGKGKKSAWEAWNLYPEVTAAFIYMSTHPHTPLTKESQHFRYLERFTVVLYDKTSSLGSVNEARRELFCQKNWTMESIPPTQDALLQHCKHVAYHAGIWTTSELAQ